MSSDRTAERSASSPPPHGFWLQVQDWRGYGEHTNRPVTPRGKNRPPPPPITRTWFATRDKADRAKAEARAVSHPDVALCVVPVPPPRAKPSPPFDDLPETRKRLTE
jgi:hypothetical protein